MQNNQKEIILLEDLGMLYPTEKSKQKYPYALYRCYCGNEFKTITYNIKNNKTKSCGCNLHKNKHNNYDTNKIKKLKNVWNAMIQRCTNPNNKAYIHYGGRGITICENWMKNSILFYEWAIDNGYEEGLTLDRKENDKGYNPENCRWVTQTVQTRNTRKLMCTNTSGYRGVSWNKSANKFISRISVDNKQIHIGCFNNIVEAAKSYDNYVAKHNLENTKNF